MMDTIITNSFNNNFDDTLNFNSNNNNNMDTSIYNNKKHKNEISQTSFNYNISNYSDNNENINNQNRNCLTDRYKKGILIFTNQFLIDKLS